MLDMLLPSEIRAVASQADVYRKAIQSSIDVSQQGYTIAVDAICLLSNRRANKADHDVYLTGTYQMASNGYDLAKKCASDFGNVRSTVFQVGSTVPNPFFLSLTDLQLIDKANQTQKSRGWNWGFKAHQEKRRM